MARPGRRLRKVDIPEQPLLSVVIAAYGGPQPLGLTLRALARQATDDPSFEVVVVDDGSPQPLQAPTGTSFPGPGIRLVRLAENRGRAIARNIGAQEARGRRLLFLDSDSCAVTGLITPHMRFARRDDGRPLLGRRIEAGWAALRDNRATGLITGPVTPHEDDLRYAYGLDIDSIDFSG